ncbi:hypothetical protein KM043_012741 [Ampulex compressa]|nr:hypothetical protein KM043_012741 [Ampulex compressa]
MQTCEFRKYVEKITLFSAEDEVGFGEILPNEIAEFRRSFCKVELGESAISGIKPRRGYRDRYRPTHLLEQPRRLELSHPAATKAQVEPGKAQQDPRLPPGCIENPNRPQTLPSCAPLVGRSEGGSEGSRGHLMLRHCTIDPPNYPYGRHGDQLPPPGLTSKKPSTPNSLRSLFTRCSWRQVTSDDKH